MNAPAKRFTLDQIVPFIGITFERHNGNVSLLGTGALYRPWEDKIKEMTIDVLGCVEHHKVPGQYGNQVDRPHDGFIFYSIPPADCSEDWMPEKWNNQFPRASYSQTSTEADYSIFRKGEGRLHARVVASHYLSQVYTGVQQLTAAGHMGSANRASQLQEHYNAVVELLRAKGFTATVEQVTHKGVLYDDWDVILTQDSTLTAPAANTETLALENQA